MVTKSSLSPPITLPLRDDPISSVSEFRSLASVGVSLLPRLMFPLNVEPPPLLPLRTTVSLPSPSDKPITVVYSAPSSRVRKLSPLPRRISPVRVAPLSMVTTSAPAPRTRSPIVVDPSRRVMASVPALPSIATPDSVVMTPPLLLSTRFTALASVPVKTIAEPIKSIPSSGPPVIVPLFSIDPLLPIRMAFWPSTVAVTLPLLTMVLSSLRSMAWLPPASSLTVTPLFTVRSMSSVSKTDGSYATEMGPVQITGVLPSTTAPSSQSAIAGSVANTHESAIKLATSFPVLPT